MKEERIFRGSGSSGYSTEYRPERKNTIIKPSIKRTFFDKDKVRMYKTTDGRTFIADVFDRIFNTAIRLNIKPKNFKPNSIDPRVIY